MPHPGTSPETLGLLHAFANFIKRYFDKDSLGVKTRSGFYSYPHPAYAEPGFLTGDTNPGASSE